MSGEPGGPGPWHGAGPELIIVAVAVAATALAGGAVAGWPGVATVAIAAAVGGLVVLRALAPRAAEQSVRTAREKQAGRPVSGYAQRWFVVTAGLSSWGFYQADLRPALEHLLAARLAERHGINLYQDPAAARKAFCRTRGDAALWRWIDPAEAALEGRDGQGRGIPRRTLARLIDRLEQL
ncbi:MAG TPA: hypothetical protein VF482_09235 [Trebonia sp.]